MKVRKYSRPSKHGVKRANERDNWNEETLDRMLPKILKYGVSHQDATGRLKKFFSWLYLSHSKIADNIRIYGNSVYIIKGIKLITIMCLHKSYQDAVNKIQKRKECENNLQH